MGLFNKTKVVEVPDAETASTSGPYKIFYFLPVIHWP